MKDIGIFDFVGRKVKSKSLILCLVFIGFTVYVNCRENVITMYEDKVGTEMNARVFGNNIMLLMISIRLKIGGTLLRLFELSRWDLGF